MENDEHGVDASPDHKYFFVTNMFETTVCVIDKEQNKVMKTVEVGEIPSGINVMPCFWQLKNA
ncbi:YncE family protein [Parageobacillus thermoglucosidasius]|uniref:6-phosphogluconolactonase n=2 Tax=Anoxybacillaceae TaxID=3120669 RepID=A0A1B7KVC1_PARTM|nr:hypothetical protein [Parageobacillus thermoglucosidasius]OAT73956.1 hypothetical protein A7K69_16720 [Parageobacillus thermoglucosidasius]